MKVSHSALAHILISSGAMFACGCVPAPEATPAPASTAVEESATPAPSPAPSPSPSPAPASGQISGIVPSADPNWIDAPRTPGTWTYGAVSGGTISRYASSGEELFAIGCMANSRSIVLIREGVDSGDGEIMTIRTETMERSVVTQRGSADAISQIFQPNDRLLDAIALTRGRFVVETMDSPTLYLPAWAEVTRVVEDCR